jgi:hypothetical protein
MIAIDHPRYDAALDSEQRERGFPCARRTERVTVLAFRGRERYARRALAEHDIQRGGLAAIAERRSGAVRVDGARCIASALNVPSACGADMWNPSLVRP